MLSKIHIMILLIFWVLIKSLNLQSWITPFILIRDDGPYESAMWAVWIPTQRLDQLVFARIFFLPLGNLYQHFTSVPLIEFLVSVIKLTLTYSLKSSEVRQLSFFSCFDHIRVNQRSWSRGSLIFLYLSFSQIMNVFPYLPGRFSIHQMVIEMIMFTTAIKYCIRSILL